VRRAGGAASELHLAALGLDVGPAALFETSEQVGELIEVDAARGIADALESLSRLIIAVALGDKGFGDVGLAEVGPVAGRERARGPE
jgi:hypothetical protein